MTPPAQTNKFGLGSFRTAAGRAFVGLVLEEEGEFQVVDLNHLELRGPTQGAAHGASLLLLLEEWDHYFPELLQAREMLSDGRRPLVVRHPLKSLENHVPYIPRQILCVGANYRTHVIDMLVAQPSPHMAGLSIEQRRAAAEKMMDERALHGVPYAFSKLPSCVAGPFDPLVLPADVQKPDWELELAVIIGRRARHVAREFALEYVAGFAIANDVTARDRVYRADIPDLATDFLAGKSSPGFLPFGPWITPRCFVDHAHLRITLELNGDLMQDGATGDMIFDVPRQIEYLSDRVELWPGDVICTGSPAGNGMHHQRFLRSGDEVYGAITGLGEIRNRCVLERPVDRCGRPLSAARLPCE
ncbi:MAG: hypothetical protein QOI59_59 [Gammaproteobacteria bacterium]|nr:hypothetical protein [Gammaproteobacteria bacterium]